MLVFRDKEFSSYFLFTFLLAGIFKLNKFTLFVYNNNERDFFVCKSFRSNTTIAFSFALVVLGERVQNHRFTSSLSAGGTVITPFTALHW